MSGGLNVLTTAPANPALAKAVEPLRREAVAAVAREAAAGGASALRKAVASPTAPIEMPPLRR